MATRNDRRGGGILGGCLAVLAVVLVLVIGGGVFVAMNWRGWSADWSVQLVEAGLEESELSEEQKSEIMVEVRVLADDFKAGKVTVKEMGRIIEEIAESPVIPVAAVYAARKGYFDESELTEEEKANADMQMQRLARGVFEEKISKAELEDAVDQIAVRTGENQFQIREPDVVTDQDLREMVDKITALVEEKEIPAEPFEVDVAAEVREAIARGRGLAPAEEAPVLEEVEPEAVEPEAVEPEAEGEGTPDGEAGGGGTPEGEAGGGGG